MIDSIKKIIKQKMKNNNIQKNNIVFSFSCTSKKEVDFKVLPSCMINDYKIIRFMISNERIAKDIFKIIDGKIQNIMIDIEKKQKIDLWKIASKYIKGSKLIPIKPNDATLEAAYLLIKNKLNNKFDKNIFIYGAGNIGSKLAIRLAESNFTVYLSSRNKDKLFLVTNTINKILPKYSTGQVIPVYDLEKMDRIIDVFISFVSAEEVIGFEFANIIKNEGLALDGGINNFNNDFLLKAHKKNIEIIRVDVRLGTSHLLLSILPETNNFFDEVQGKRKIKGINVVSGGVIGQKGDVVVDKIKSPNKVIGIANGYGGLIDEPEEKYKDKIKEIENYLQNN